MLKFDASVFVLLGCFLMVAQQFTIYLGVFLFGSLRVGFFMLPGLG